MTGHMCIENNAPGPEHIGARFRVAENQVYEGTVSWVGDFGTEIVLDDGTHVTFVRKGLTRAGRTKIDWHRVIDPEERRVRNEIATEMRRRQAGLQAGLIRGGEREEGAWTAWDIAISVVEGPVKRGATSGAGETT